MAQCCSCVHLKELDKQRLRSKDPNTEKRHTPKRKEQHGKEKLNEEEFRQDKIKTYLGY